MSIFSKIFGKKEVWVVSPKPYAVDVYIHRDDMNPIYKKMFEYDYENGIFYIPAKVYAEMYAQDVITSGFSIQTGFKTYYPVHRVKEVDVRPLME